MARKSATANPLPPPTRLTTTEVSTAQLIQLSYGPGPGVILSIWLLGK